MITLGNHALRSYMTWLLVTLTWLPVTLTWLLYNLQVWRHGRWFRKFTVRFRPIIKELESSMYNNKGNHLNFAPIVLLAVSEEAETWLPSFCVQCIIKQLLDSVFVISRIIKVSVRVTSLSIRLRLITHTSTLIILDITKTSSNNCLQSCVFSLFVVSRNFAPNTAWQVCNFHIRNFKLALNFSLKSNLLLKLDIYHDHPGTEVASH